MVHMQNVIIDLKPVTVSLRTMIMLNLMQRIRWEMLLDESMMIGVSPFPFTRVICTSPIVSFNDVV